MPSWSVPRIGRVAAGSFVGLAAGDEELAAARGERRVSAPPHPGDRQEAEQDEVDQRDQQLFEQTPTVSWCGIPLARSAPDSLEKSGHASEGVGGQPDVGVEEDEQGMTGLLGQHPAGVLLAAPAGGKLGRGDQTHPIVGLGQLTHDRGGPVFRVIVQDDDFELDVRGWPERHAPKRQIAASSFRAGISTEIAGSRLSGQGAGGWGIRLEIGAERRARESEARMAGENDQSES